MIGSTLISNVRQRLPATVVTLAGTLDKSSMPIAEAVLRDCLAEMPAAILIDGSELMIADTDTAYQLASIASSAAIWPGVTVCVCALPPESFRDGLMVFDSIEAAENALGHWPTGEQRRLMWLSPVPESCERARDFVAEACTDWEMRKFSRLAQLVVSELVANGVRHARTVLRVGVRQQSGRLEVSVRDEDPRLISSVLPDDPAGFGLQLVEAMSTSWGCAATGTGKVVWSKI